MSLRAALRREAARGPIGMVVLDYIQLMQSISVKRNDNRNNEISEISRGIKVLAMELKCPFIVLSQLSRESVKEGIEPELHHLRDSGALEQDADVVMFPHIPDTSDKKAAIIDMKLLIKKQRNGPLGDVNLEFTRRFTRFDERTT